jgi:hypothetical protein
MQDEQQDFRLPGGPQGGGEGAEVLGARSAVAAVWDLRSLSS